jgi:sulfhydrogenase subunit alpha
MSKSVTVDVHHITRVEGHGNIKVDVKNGELKECKLEIVESPRFFEAMLMGRHYTEAATITSRVCGICSVGHQLASIAATEDALGINLSIQNKQLSKLLDCGQYYESHVLHIYFLAVPDFVGAKSVLPLVSTHKETVVSALKLKKLGHDIGEMIAGRLVHPISMGVGGFTAIPSVQKLENMKARLIDAQKDLNDAVSLVKKLSLPNYKRETEYISLHNPGDYAFLHGNIFSSDTGKISYKDYRKVTNEYLVNHSTAKRTKNTRDSYMVGALARFNNNHQWLSEKAKQVASDIGLKAPCYNPYLNTVAQLVELFHITDECVSIIDNLLAKEVKKESPTAPPSLSGTGIGAVEVPRGILFHEYTYENGYITNANCIIPTGQNLQNIEEDMRKFVPEMIQDKSKKEITLLLEMLVRAYDPCISCSCHLLEVEFV